MRWAARDGVKNKCKELQAEIERTDFRRGGGGGGYLWYLILYPVSFKHRVQLLLLPLPLPLPLLHGPQLVPPQTKNFESKH